MKLIVNAMLGNLARYLRILGYDTLYARDFEDSRIVSMCIRERRILVTKDRRLADLASKRGCKSILLNNELAETPQLLGYLATKLGLSLKVDFSRTRCPLCNTLLIRIGEEEKRQAGLMSAGGAFKCPACGNYYWIGKHWKGITECLEEASEWKRSLSGLKS